MLLLEQFPFALVPVSRTALLALEKQRFFYATALVTLKTISARAKRAWPPREGLAGAEGFEPPLAVLETAGLPLNLRPYINLASPSARISSLLDLLVRMMFTAERAELLDLQPFRHGFLVLHAGVILALALGALKRDLFSRHVYSLAGSRSSSVLLTLLRAQRSGPRFLSSSNRPRPVPCART
jgi:hypothetical protein